MREDRIQSYSVVLTITNQGSSGNGLVFSSGGGLIMEGCLIKGFSNNGSSNGLSFQAGAALDVRDSLFVGNSTGVTVSAGSATFDQVRFERNVVGIWTQGSATVMMRNSIASHNTDGFLCSTTSSATAEMNIENCASTYNHVAIEVESEQGTARVRFSNSTVTNNDFGLSVEGFGGPVLLSRGNNTVEGNTTNINGTIGSYSAK